MDKKTIGIIVTNDFDNILCYENNFFISIDIEQKDELRFILEDKLEEILDDKSFIIDKISKKIPELKLSDSINNTENMTMYLVKVYMFRDNSKFSPKEKILDCISNPLHKDYYIKYILRYNKYRTLVDSCLSIPIYLFFTMVILKFPFEIKINSLFDNFLIDMFIYIAVPIFIFYRFIVPSITNFLVNYDISKKSFKICKVLYWIGYLIFCFSLLANIWLQK